MRDNKRPAHDRLPEEGLHLMIGINQAVDAAQEDAYRGLFVDVSIEDIVAAWTIGHFLTVLEGMESQDQESRPAYHMTIFAGREVRWSIVISQDAIVAIRAFFASTDFRQGLRGAEVLRAFESREVKEARDTEVSAVLATWREIVAEA